MIIYNRNRSKPRGALAFTKVSLPPPASQVTTKESFQLVHQNKRSVTAKDNKAKKVVFPRRTPLDVTSLNRITKFRIRSTCHNGWRWWCPLQNGNKSDIDYYSRPRKFNSSHWIYHPNFLVPHRPLHCHWSWISLLL